MHLTSAANEARDQLRARRRTLSKRKAGTIMRGTLQQRAPNTY